MTPAFVGALMLATGAVLFTVGFQERHDARDLRARGLVADATVVDTAAAPRVQQVGGVFSAHYGQRVTFHFDDQQGRPRSTTMRFSSTGHSLGETVRLVYDPSAPGRVDLFESCNGWFSCDRPWVVSMALGTSICLIGFGLAISAHRPRGTPPTPARSTDSTH
jgi:hypothetical protein